MINKIKITVTNTKTVNNEGKTNVKIIEIKIATDNKESINLKNLNLLESDS